MRMSFQIITTIFAFWAGFVTAISFLEAWLKFKAPGVTREVGLGIGKLVFTALNRVEIVLAIAIWILLFLHKSYQVSQLTLQNIMFWLVTLLLVLQTFWLLPKLMQRAEIIISGGEPTSSSVHLWFIFFEVTKVVLLIVLAIKFKVPK